MKEKDFVNYDDAAKLVSDIYERLFIVARGY